jgi:O-antigen/teichoic acid export membrane protein
MIKLKQFDNRELLSQLSVVVAGAVVSQLINLSAVLILTRLFTPHEFGNFGAYTAIVTLGAVAAGLRYELAISLPKRKGTAANLLALSLVCVITFALAMVFVVVALDLNGMLVDVKLLGYVYALPLGIAVAGIYQTIIYWAVYNEQFKHISKSRVGQSSIALAVQIAFGWIGTGIVGLIVGSQISHLAGVVFLIIAIGVGKRATFRQVSWSRMRLLAIHFNRFPKFSILEGLAASAGTQLPILVFAASFSSTLSGQFVLALQIAQAPLRLLGSSMGQVLFSRAAEAKRLGNLVDLMSSSMRYLARLGIAPFLMATVIAPELFSMIFGETWLVAGTYVSYLIPILAIEFIFAPLSVAVAAIESKFIALFSRLLLVGIPLLAMYAMANTKGEPIMAIVSYSVTGCLAYLAYGSWLMNVSCVPTRVWTKTLFIEILLAFIPFLSLIGIKLLIDPVEFRGFIVGLGVLCICLWFYLFSRKMIE